MIKSIEDQIHQDHVELIKKLNLKNHDRFRTECMNHLTYKFGHMPVPKECVDEVNRNYALKILTTFDNYLHDGNLREMNELSDDIYRKYGQTPPRLTTKRSEMDLLLNMVQGKQDLQ
jgi:hypothetical protein